MTFTLAGIVNDFPTFCRYMFNEMGLPEPTEAQLELAAYLGSSKKDKMLLALRGLGKSIFAQLYVIWRLLRNQDEHILVISGSSKRSKNFTNFCLSMIKSTKLLRHLNPRPDQRRASDHFDVNGSNPSDSPNMYAAGIGTGLAGFRATIIVSDDIEQPQNSRTPEARDTLVHFFNEATNLLIQDGTLEGSGDTIILGTYQSRDSIYKTIETGGYDVFIIPAEYPKDDSLYGKRLAPYLAARLKAIPELAGSPVDSRFPAEVLNKKKLKLGKSSYELQFLLNPADSDSLKYPLKLSDIIVTDVDEIDNPLRFVYSSANTIKLNYNGFADD